MSKNELYHFGRKGMKWYQHIFGDEDSRAKYASSYQQGSKISSDARSVVGSAGRIKNISKQKDVSKMSDEELRSIINRMNMEQQYTNLTTNKVSKGQAYVQETLSIAGGVMAITSSALTIALTIKKLKGA